MTAAGTQRTSPGRGRWILGVCLVAGLLIAAKIGAQIRWNRMHNPAGKFTTAVEYLRSGRSPSRVVRGYPNGTTYWIAFGPLDRPTLMHVPSGPAAYVFDSSGRLVDWSADTGDDPTFQQKWLVDTEAASIEDLKALGPSGE